MKRNVAMALLVTAIVALAVLLMPATLAKKDRKDAAKKALASERTTPGFPELFKTNAQPQSDPGPISRPAAKFAVSPPLRELAEKAATADYQEPRSIKFRGEEEREINERNREQIRTMNPNVVPDRDGALRESPTAPQVLPTPSLVIDGNSNADNAILLGFRLSPPDTEGDVGPNHYVQVINLTLRIFNKTGTSLLGPVKFSTIFTPLGPPCAAQDDGDPIALYDPMADRWLLSQFCLPNPDPGPYFQEIAISQTGDPTGAYNLYAFDVSTGNQEFNDYPHFGVWPDAYYMSTNQFFQGASFDGSGVFAFNRQKMLLGDPTANFIYFNRNLASFPEGQAGFLPADMDGVKPPAVGTPCPFAYFVANEFSDPADGMRIFDFHADFTTPASSTFIERPESTAVCVGCGIPVAAFNPRNPVGQDDVPQPGVGATSRLDSISDRLMHRLQYINFGTFESLVVNHTVNVGADDTTNYRAAIRYYQFRKNLGVNPYSAFEQGTWSGAGNDTTHRWMGSAAVNAAGDLAVGFSASSTTVKPSILYAARFSTDPAGSLAQGEQTMFAGDGVQTDTGSRWGDYSALSLDPSDDCSFWYTTETYTAASQATSGVGWITKIGKFNLGTPCTGFQKGTISGQVTNCSGGAPIAGVVVRTDDGFFTTTDAGGKYTLPKMATGNYSVTASKPGFSTANAPGVTVTNGNTTTQNFCLAAINIVTNGGSSVVSGGANNMLDPGEIVTVSLGVTNTGGPGACFTNLIGDVQPTGGVQTHPPTSNFGAFCSGAPTVVRNFTFRVNPALACGATVTVTMNLQDGATPYGPLTFTFPTGTLNTTNFSYTGSPVVIPDNSPTGVNINIPVSGITGNTGDVNFKIDGTTCSSAAGSTTVGVDHTWVGDLIFKLTAPNGGPTLSIINRPGGGTFGSSGNNFCQTLLDDEAPGGSLNIQNISSSGAPPSGPPFTGTFFPAVSLSGFDGFNPNGTWVLNVSDVESAFTGNVRAFTLQVSVFQCQTPTTAAIISGQVTYLDGATAVKDVGAMLSGDQSQSTTTDVNGNYAFNGVPAGGNYAVTPSRTGDVNGITAFDASLAARFALDLITLTPNQQIAGDASNNGTVTAFDASEIARSALGIANPGIAGSWKFAPTILTFNSLSGDQLQQNFAAILVGDVSGNWVPPPQPSMMRSPSGVAAIPVVLPNRHDPPGGLSTINITVGDLTNQGVFAYDFDMMFDPTVLQPQNPAFDATGTLSSGLSVNANTSTPGHVMVNAFGTSAMAGQGILLKLKFNVVGAAGSQTPLTWVSFNFNEGDPPDTTFNGQFTATGPTAAPALVSGRITTPDGSPLGGAVMRLNGAATRTTISDSAGNYRFENVQTDNFYTVTPALANYSFAPASRSFSLAGNITDAGFTANPDVVQSANAIDMTEYFVRQQYLDFLGREPDQGGLEYWSAQINQCGGDANCIRNKRIDVSAAFFASAEFQQTGSYIYGLYAGTLGRTLNYGEFNADRSQVLGGSGLDQAKTAFAQAFVQRPEFTSRYPQGMTREQFVDAVIQTMTTRSGVDHSSLRNQLLGDYDVGGRALVARHASEASSFVAAEYNKAFVLMEYFGYMRREIDQGGYDYWLDVLNHGAAGNYRGMVCAFLTSTEYQRRFSTVITRSNAECGH